MKMAILHTSDLHIKESDNYIFARVEKIKNAVHTVIADIEHCFIVVCGDIALSGNRNQYKVASEFLWNLQSTFKSMNDSIELQYILVPGNHDCNLKAPPAERATTIQELMKRPDIANNLDCIEVCTSVQDEFFELLAQMTNRKDVGASARLYYTQEFLVNKYKIRFNCYNTAWMTQEQEHTQCIVFPLDILPTTNNECDLVFSVLHHPCHWLQAEENRQFRQNLERTSNIILTGHEHISTQYSQKKITGEENVYVQGGVLQQQDDKDSSFNILIIDLKQRSYKFYDYSWKNGIYKPVQASDNWEPIPRNKYLMQDKFINNKEYERCLDDPGATFKHPMKGDLSLSDIYLYPDLREMGTKKTVTIGSKSVPQYIFNSKKLIILGDEKSGKTCLLKVLYKYFRNQGLTPLMIDGASIVSAKDEKICGLIDDNFVSQYSKDYLEDYRQLSANDKVLLIDNYDKVKLNLRGRNRFLNYMKKKSERIVLTANELLELEEAVQYSDSFSSLVEFKRAGIMEFGHLHRSRTVEHWFYLGRDETADNSQIEHKIASAENTINTILGENLLPSYPIFILTVLQALEVGVPHSTALGAYGYLYEFLITQALAITSRRIDLDTEYKYLSEIAYHMFTRNITRLTPDEIQQFHNYYCQEYLRLSFTDILEDLTTSHMLTYQDSYCSFKYRYIYYYFVAREMNARLQDPEEEARIRNEIRELIKNVHKEDCANILIFLSYLSQDPFIRKEMLNKTKEIFRLISPCDLDRDVEFINRLGFELTDLRLPKIGYKKAKEKYLEQKDKGEKVFRHKGEDEEMTSTEFITSVNAAFKTIQVMGQVLRNFAGSMKGSIKYELTKQSYLLGLRALKVILEMIEANLQGFKSYIKMWAIEQHKVEGTNHEIAIMVNRSCFRLLEFFVLGVIRIISRATGSERLKDTYEKVGQTINLLSVTFIQMATRLEHFSDIPQQEIIVLNDELKANIVAQDILRHLVYDRLVLYRCEYRIKQALCKKLEISARDPRLIDSPQRKSK